MCHIALGHIPKIFLRPALVNVCVRDYARRHFSLRLSLVLSWVCPPPRVASSETVAVAACDGRQRAGYYQSTTAAL